MDPINESFEEFKNHLYENRITYKRKYTDAHPAKYVNANSKTRNAMLNAIGDGTVTEEEFDGIAKSSNANKSWLKRHAILFNITESGTELSTIGKRIFNQLSEVSTVNEGEEGTENVDEPANLSKLAGGITKIQNDMKKLAGEYKRAKGSSDDAKMTTIKDELKVLGANKAKLETEFDNAIADIDKGVNLIIQESLLEEELLENLAKSLTVTQKEIISLSEALKHAVESKDEESIITIKENINTAREGLSKIIVDIDKIVTED